MPNASAAIADSEVDESVATTRKAAASPIASHEMQHVNTVMLVSRHIPALDDVWAPLLDDLMAPARGPSASARHAWCRPAMLRDLCDSAWMPGSREGATGWEALFLECVRALDQRDRVAR